MIKNNNHVGLEDKNKYFHNIIQIWLLQEDKVSLFD